MAYSRKQIGSKYSPSFKIYILENEKVISPFHDIPLMSGEHLNCINEIPRFEHAKFEICKEEAFNPICQDVKNGKVRFVKNLFPTFGYPFNYGALPQTWENPGMEDPDCKAKGDNDPLDIVEIGSKVKAVGEVYQGKVLGAFALLDDGEADWKVVVIDVKDEMASQVNDMDDIKKYFPGLYDHILTWFRDYKFPDGKPKNKFACNAKCFTPKEVRCIIERAHEHWKSLLADGYGNIKTENSTQAGSKSHMPGGIIIDAETGPDALIAEDLDRFYYAPAE